MTPPVTIGILDSVAGGRYEEALGVPLGALSETMNRAHVRLLSGHRDDPAVREALNRAKGTLSREGHLERARRLLRIGRTEEALAHLQHRADEASDPDELHLIGYTLYQLGRYQEALEFLERAAALRRGATDLLWLGNACERLERWDAALDSYRQAVELRGSAIECHLLGNMLLKLERFDEALPAFDRAIGLGLLDSELLDKRRLLMRRRNRKRLRSRALVAISRLKRDPIDWLMMSLALAYGVYFLVLYLQ